MTTPISQAPVGVKARKLGYAYDLLYDIKTVEKLQEEVEYLAHRLAGLARLCREDGYSIDDYVTTVLGFNNCTFSHDGNTENDLYWHALNYRTAGIQEAEVMWQELQACVKRLIDAEREACAKLCELVELRQDNILYEQKPKSKFAKCAEAIRMRSKV